MDYRWDSTLGETADGLDAEKGLAESIRVKVGFLVATPESISLKTRRVRAVCVTTGSQRQACLLLCCALPGMNFGDIPLNICSRRYTGMVVRMRAAVAWTNDQAELGIDQVVRTVMWWFQ